MFHVTFVKKILANGELCKKCQEVAARLQSEGLLGTIDHIAIADERDADSEGIRLARKHAITRAPFFLVEHEPGTVIAFDVYFKFKKYMAEQGLGQARVAAL